MQANRIRDRILVRLAASGLVALIGCMDTGAPDDSTIVVTANPSTLGTGGAVTQISAVLRDATGQIVKDGTVVVFTTSLGGLCLRRDCGDADSLPAARSTSAWEGIAVAYLVTGSASGQATVTARSGRAEGSVSVNISGLVAPFGARAILTSESDSVDPGTKVGIRAYLTDSLGSPLPTNTRVVFETTRGVISPVIALTRSGFADATLTADSVAGPDTVKLRSGPLSSSIVIEIR